MGSVDSGERDLGPQALHDRETAAQRALFLAGEGEFGEPGARDVAEQGRLGLVGQAERLLPGDGLGAAEHLRGQGLARAGIDALEQRGELEVEQRVLRGEWRLVLALEHLREDGIAGGENGHGVRFIRG